MARPATITDEMVAVTDDVVAALGKLANDMDAVKADCSKAAQVIRASYEPAKVLAARSARFKGATDRDPAAVKWLEQTYGDRFADAIRKLQGVTVACEQSDELLQAMTGYPLAQP